MQEHGHLHVAGDADGNSWHPTDRGIRSRHVFLFAASTDMMSVTPHESLSLGTIFLLLDIT